MRTNVCKPSLFLSSLITGFVLSLSAPFAWAQEGFVRHLITTVKPDRIGEFESLLEERAAGLRAAGQQPFRSVYETLQGDQFTYVIVDFWPSLAAMGEPLDPGPNVSPNWITRLDNTVVSQRSVTLRHYPDLTIPPEPGYERDLVRVRIRRNAPGRTQDYQAWLAEQFVPALRDAGVTGHITSRVILGGNGQSWVTLSNVTLESMGFGLGNALGERRVTQVFSAAEGLVVYGEDYLMRFRPDLGFRNEGLLTQNQ